MKTKAKKKEISTVQEIRKIRDTIGTEIKDMTYEELKKYIDGKSTLHPKSVWQNRE